eukprot:Lankesteria_metandrocarpae@DN7616_c0_g1_i1.p1
MVVQTAATKGGAKRTKAGKPIKKTKKFTLNCAVPVDDKILDAKSLADFCKGKIQTTGKHSDLPQRVTIKHDAKCVHFEVQLPFAKRYIKYLTKKYLVKQKLRDFLRVVAHDKNTYDVRYFSIPSDEAA